MDKQSKQNGWEYQALLDNIPGGVQQCLHDENRTIVAVNQGFLDMFGFSREDIRKRFQDHFLAMVHPADRQAFLREGAEQLSQGGKMALSYRVFCQNGSYKWVASNGHLVRGDNGEEWLLSVMLDVTESRVDREELRLSLERHQIVLDQTTDIIFEWDLLNDVMTFSANWQKKFGYPPRYDGLAQQATVYRHIHPQDVGVLQELMTDAQSGKAYVTDDIRIQKADGKYVWCRIRAAGQFDDDGLPIKTVGVITDIDEEKRMIDELRQRAERDALTGLCNREETERQIRQYLATKPTELCALYIIDTDNFKMINDGQGHLFGDTVLMELAAGMKRMTRQSDVVGRIGGDEFAIFLKDIPSREMAADKAVMLLDMFQHLFQDEKQRFEITCSTGVAVYPEAGNDFTSLYRSADLALYQAKNQGKNQYVLFDPKTALTVEQTGYSSLGAAIDSDQRTALLSGELVNYVFQVLYDTTDVNYAIQLILEIIGKRFDVSRAYIFENSADGRYTDNTYEWCNEGIIPQKDSLQHFPYDSLEGYEELFKDDAVFYCRDIYSLAPAQVALFEQQGIHSTLQCAIREGEAFRGFVGFDECTGRRMWTKEEIGVLSLISQLLTIFLQRKRATDHDRQMVLQLNTILDVQDAYIYVVEQESYELLYLNNKLRALDPRAGIGMVCHKAFFGRDIPCADCPILGGNNEIYNDKYDVWVKVQMAPINWGDRTAYLLSCFDVSDYKKTFDCHSPAAGAGRS